MRSLASAYKNDNVVDGEFFVNFGEPFSADIIGVVDNNTCGVEMCVRLCTPKCKQFGKDNEKQIYPKYECMRAILVGVPVLADNVGSCIWKSFISLGTCVISFGIALVRTGRVWYGSVARPGLRGLCFDFNTVP